MNFIAKEKIILIKLGTKSVFSALQNPSKSELQAFAKEVFNYRKNTGQTMPDGTVLRYAIDDKRNMYVGDAIDGTHNDIETFLNETDEDTKTVDHGYKSGVFSYYSEKLQLTLPNSLKPGIWRLPAWMYPIDDKTPLTYHSDLVRWEEKEGYVQLQSASRGQEFVLDCSDYPEAHDWLANLLE